MGILDKPMDLEKVDLTITFPGIGTYTLKEFKEIDVNSTEDSHTLTDPDIKGNVRTIKNNVSKTEIKVVTIKGSDDDIFLKRCEKNTGKRLGTLTYIDDTGDNKVVGTGQGVSIQKKAERKNNTKDIEIEYTVQCAKYDE